MVVFVSDLFIKDYVGGGELSTQALIETCLLPVAQINSRYLTVDTMKQHKNAHWIFGNFTDVNLECLVYAIKNLSYTVIEYDYKFCYYVYATLKSCNVDESQSKTTLYEQIPIS